MNDFTQAYIQGLHVGVQKGAMNLEAIAAKGKEIGGAALSKGKELGGAALAGGQNMLAKGKALASPAMDAVGNAAGAVGDFAVENPATMIGGGAGMLAGGAAGGMGENGSVLKMLLGGLGGGAAGAGAGQLYDQNQDLSAQNEHLEDRASSYQGQILDLLKDQQG